MNENERVQPMRVTDNDTGDTYTLDFNRDSVRFAEDRRFDISEVPTFPATKIPELWYYAFRMHHRKMDRYHTDALLEKIGGLTKSMIERLVLLYQQACVSNNIQDEEDLAKNARVTVEL